MTHATSYAARAAEAADLVRGYRALADLIEARPDLAPAFRGGGSDRTVTAYVGRSADPFGDMAAVAKACASSGIEVTPGTDEHYGFINLRINSRFTVQMFAPRAQVAKPYIGGWPADEYIPPLKVEWRMPDPLGTEAAS